MRRMLCAAQRFNQSNALKRTIFELIAQELLLTLVPDPSVHGSASAKVGMCVACAFGPLLYPDAIHAISCEHAGVVLERQTFPYMVTYLCRDLDNEERPQASHKRPLERAPARVSPRLAFQGPGGGAIEGPPLLGRVSAGSAHGGLEYYRYCEEHLHAANACPSSKRRGIENERHKYLRQLARSDP